jgi:hypothetical protein
MLQRTKALLARGAILGLFLVLVGGCSLIRKTVPTDISVKTGTTEVKMSNDGSAQSAPSVDTKSDDTVVPIPAGSKITVTEYREQPPVARGEQSPPPVEARQTVIAFPQDKGSEVRVKSSQIKTTGSVGFTPPPPATPYEKSLGWWSYAGIALVLVGVFFCTPWGGSNVRVGAMIAAGGLTMSLLGLFLNELSNWAKYKMPDWLPAVGLLGVIAAILLYWGYRVRLKHEQQSPAQETKTP